MISCSFFTRLQHRRVNDTASVKLEVVTEDEVLTWNFKCNDAEWQSALLSKIGKPIEQDTSYKAGKATGKVFNAIFNMIERITRPKKV